MVLLRGRGELGLARGRHDEAWNCVAQSLELAVQSGSSKHVLPAQRLQGLILTANGRLEAAAQKLKASIRWAEQIQTPREVWLGQAALGKVRFPQDSAHAPLTSRKAPLQSSHLHPDADSRT